MLHNLHTFIFVFLRCLKTLQLVKGIPIVMFKLNNLLLTTIVSNIDGCLCNLHSPFSIKIFKGQLL